VRGALRDARFRRLLAGRALSGFGDSALYIVLAIWVKELTGSNGAAGLVFFALGAMSLLAPLGGYLVDRVHRRLVVITVDALTAAVVCLLVFVHSRDQLWLIYVVAAAYGLSGTIVGPAMSALLKDLLADDDLGGANAARQTLDQGLRLLSPLVGAGLFAAFGGGWLAAFDAATFLAGIAAVCSVRLTETPVEVHEQRPALRSELAKGFRHIATTVALRRIAIAAGVAMLGIGLFESIDFAVVAALGHAPAFLGVLLSVQAAGSIAGGVVVAGVMRRQGESPVVAAGLVSFAVAAVGLMLHSLVVVLLAVIVIGAGVSWFFVGVGTAMQRFTPPRLQGRVAAANYVLLDIPQTLSIACGAALIAAVDYRVLLGVLALATGVCGVLLVLYARTDIEPGTLPSGPAEVVEPVRS
jgi:MFS family permease